MSDWNWMQWDEKAMETAVEAALRTKKEALQKVKEIPADQRTFENTIAALERASYELSDVEQCLGLLENVLPDAKLRDAAHEQAKRIHDADAELEYDPELWRAVQEWEKTGELERLRGPDRKLAEDCIRDMRRMGLGLPADKLAELKKTHLRLQHLESDFEKAINDWDDGIWVTEKELKGLPDRYIKALRTDADGRYRISLEYPDLFPFMELAEDDESRRLLATKNLKKGGEENLKRLSDMIALRNKGAGILGYRTHADYVCEDHMAHDAETVQSFLKHLLTQLQPLKQKEFHDLIVLKQRLRGLEKPRPIHFYEVAYWSEKDRREQFKFDAETIKEYFPLEAVLEGMFTLYQNVLGLRFAPAPEIPTWHSDVSAYTVHDAEDDQLLGHFFLDLHPRAGKYGHAAAFPILVSDSDRRGIMALVCNLPRPTKEQPALLDHEEVETVLHEFGHVMHGLLSKTAWRSQNGLGVALDFVEALSQLFEYWAWDARSLALLSRHWKTGKPMPEELRDSLLKSKNHLQASSYLSQAVRSWYDLWMHAQPTDTTLTPEAIAEQGRALRLQLEAIELPDDAIYAAGWGHMSDYDAGYYGYLWSRVFAADMFQVFAADPLSPEIGKRYRETVLEPGASQKELDLVKAFLQREPSDEAFLKELGIQNLAPTQEGE